MKEINGTVTLAYVEEDNKQRVIFRVIPLCTREGCVFHGGAEDFPDEGSLRIVPDKREQSTFKERMRGIGGLCTIHLAIDGKELVKVRQNRNYAPDQGEKNKLAIYSDVICEFTGEGCFEVLAFGANAQDAITPSILLLKDKVLYGPVAKDEASTVALSDLHPFGNDRFLLHTIENPLLGQRQIYWNPEMVLNWRQRKNALRRRDRTMEDDVPSAPKSQKEDTGHVASDAPTPDTEKKAMNTNAEAIDAPAQLSAPSEPVRVEPRMRRMERSAQILKEQQMAQDALTEAAPSQEEEAPKADAALPIGSKLDILDADLSFDQQISRLAQPLSSSANRLSAEEAAAEEEPEQVTAHFSGTPLVASAKPITRSTSKPESVHRVVEQQIKRKDTEEPDGLTGEIVDNPIDHLRTCLDYVWQSADMRTQAIAALSDNETFMRDMLQAFRCRGLNTQASAAAQEQLAEIEAERLSLLMQLETAKANEKKFREEAIASLSQKLRTESDKLKQEVAELTSTKEKLTQTVAVMSSDVSGKTVDFLSHNMECLSGAGEKRILLSPVTGHHYAAKELAEKIRIHMNESGYAINEDDAMNLLIYFSINDALCLSAATDADAARFAQVLLESLGLQSVSGVVSPGSYVEVISLLPEDGQRTPTVTVQALGTETMSIYGHKTLYLTTDFAYESGVLPLSYPLIRVPHMMKRSFGRNNDWEAVKPAALSCFQDLRSDLHPMLDEAEKWFDELKAGIAVSDLQLPESMLVNMRRFIEVATRKVRGGFLAAADSAVCHWVIPAMRLRPSASVQQLGELLAGLPKAMDLMKTK